MSPWRQSLRQASFRGVPFYTKTTTSEQGRRNAIHEYPQRDLAYLEDMGRKGRAFTLEAYVIGPNYMPARDALIAALETPGPGTLVHPYRGNLNVALTAPARIIESADEGGMARFTLMFMETGDNTQPSIRPDTSALVGAAADAANASLNTSFGKTFNVAGMADYVATEASAVVNSALNTITKVANFGRTGPLSELLNSATTISNSISSLMLAPTMLATAIQGQLLGLSNLVQNPQDAYSNMQSFFGSSPEPIQVSYVPATTPSRIQQSVNQTGVLDLVRRTAVVEAARASSQMTFGSYNEAQATQAALTDALDAELISNTLMPDGTTVPLDDDVYDVLLDLRVAVVRDISTRGANLAKLTTVTLQSTMPSLVAAYRIFGDCTMESDLVDRNNIVRPGFVPGGVALEVLSNG
jgi:prophage DNA circulation protein